jgi:uncharacterized protein YjiS (DUF1127 family)
VTKYNMTQEMAARTELRRPGTFLSNPLQRLLAIVHEWRNRRNIERSLGCLSNFHLRDIGLTKSDIHAACADNFDQAAVRALKGAAQSRMSNW